MRDVCLCISSIAIVEIPGNLWPDFVSLMSQQGDQDENQFFKMAGIYNLGLIMEVLEVRDFSCQDDLGRIWFTMLGNIKPENLNLTRIVAKSISKLCFSSAENFKYDEQREKIMQGIFDLLKIADAEVLNSTMEALIRIVEINYKYMGPFLPHLMKVTEQMVVAAQGGD